VFSTDVDALWEELVKRFGHQQAPAKGLRNTSLTNH
jgi:hypothetical protein